MIEEFNNLTICPVCGVRKDGESFYFSFKPKQPVVPSEVYSKVCRHAKKSGCINTSTDYNEQLDYPDIVATNYL